MTHLTLRSDQPGIALAMVLLAMVAVGAVSAAAALVGSNAVAIHARVHDAEGNEIPGIHRTTYVGPTGATTG